MSKNMIRFTLIAALLGIALVTVELSPKTYSRHTEEIQLVSYAWGVSSPQFMRICIGNGIGAPPPSRVAVVDNFSVSFGSIDLEFNTTVLETELQVPFNEFRCQDFSYQSLVAAGLVPQSNSALSFFVTIKKRSSQGTVGASEAVTVGAAQNIDVVTGEIKLYQPFRVDPAKQLTIIQDI